MKVLVIGATGGTGRHVVRRLLEGGDWVRAFARNPVDLEVTHARLEVLQGDARDGTAVDRAVLGVDAVIVAFGPRSTKRGDIQEALARNLVAAMRARGVKRLINLSAAGAGDSARTSGWMISLVRHTLYRHVYADKDRGEAILLGADLDYVNVRPAQVLDGPARGPVRASLDRREVDGKVTRDDLAGFMIEQLRSDRWLGTSPFVGSST